MIHSFDEFWRLACSEEAPDRWRARHEELAPAVWEAIVSTDSEEVRVEGILNKTVPVRVLGALAGDCRSRVRYCVAMKRKADADLLTRLVYDSDACVRARVARHRHTPEHVLEMLAHDDDCIVRNEALRALGRSEQPDE